MCSALTGSVVAVAELWMRPDDLRVMESYAEEKHPLETGGMILGYHAASMDATVVTHVLGPGTYAAHQPNSFYPDGAYHQEQLSSIYSKTDGYCTYIGDWHTHPCGPPSPSMRDRRTLQKIRRTRSSRCPNPLMIILVGDPSRYAAIAFQLDSSSGFLDRLYGRTRRLDIRTYTSLPEPISGLLK